ncbi:MAG TPA: hypothetical protein VGN76_02410, partial [Gemmatimonadales bacterium]|nr:hypothetical protein [Gemmatimonadales bacterium]
MMRRWILAGSWCTQALALATLEAQQPAPGARDSSFMLSTDDPRRSPSPFIGNGRLGVVIPALGIGASTSMMAGMYEEAPSDVPRVVTVPAWNAIEVYSGDRWLEAKAADDGSVSAYRQVLDLKTGTARTSYHWTVGSKPMSVRVETFISRADPHLSAVRLSLAPQYQGRLRVRFALLGWPPPRRLPLATLEKAERDWQPADIWYPGHMVVRSRSATRVSGGARLSVTATPEGCPATILAQAAAVTWGKELPGVTVRTTATGDTARVEIAFDASRGRSYTFTQIVSSASSADGPSPLPLLTRQAQTAQARGYEALAADNARAW